MREGQIVFDGTPEDLTTNVARDIYGAGNNFSETATSTEIREPSAAVLSFDDAVAMAN
jgi:phosphonate transport system ATP-binding protein